MRTLFLLRHAKSDWSQPVLDDKERCLNPRGRRDAASIAQYCIEQGISPSLILCSTATRTRETLALLQTSFGRQPENLFDDTLYLAGAGEILTRIRNTDNKHGSVMVIGHNPGMHHVACDLAGEDVCGQAVRMSDKFPTAALAEITFPSNDWTDIGPDQGMLERFVAPKML